MPGKASLWNAKQGGFELMEVLITSPPVNTTNSDWGNLWSNKLFIIIIFPALLSVVESIMACKYMAKKYIKILLLLLNC